MSADYRRRKFGGAISASGAETLTNCVNKDLQRPMREYSVSQCEEMTAARRVDSRASSSRVSRHCLAGDMMCHGKVTAASCEPSDMLARLTRKLPWIREARPDAARMKSELQVALKLGVHPTAVSLFYRVAWMHSKRRLAVAVSVCFLLRTGRCWDE
jgi:hypothetical protein